MLTFIVDSLTSSLGHQDHRYRTRTVDSMFSADMGRGFKLYILRARSQETKDQFLTIGARLTYDATRFTKDGTIIQTVLPNLIYLQASSFPVSGNRALWLSLYQEC